MNIGDKDKQSASAVNENRKRRKEKWAIILLGILFLILTLIEFRLFDISQSLPFVSSIFFFGLVNFNIILFLLLVFLIFRNIVKVFSEKEGGWAGSTLKGKLIAAFVGFSFVPTALMFLVSVFYINHSFDRWFSEKVEGVLKSSLEVNNAFYTSEKKRNYHFAHIVAEELAGNENLLIKTKSPQRLSELREKFRLDSVEYYPSLFGKRVIAQGADELIPDIPEVSLEFRTKGIGQGAEGSIIHHFGEGNLVRVIVPVGKAGDQGAIVVSSFIPLSLISKMDDIAATYKDLRGDSPLTFPLKSIHLSILVLMTLVILLGATWFGFYLAKQLSIPLVRLSEASQSVAKGDFRLVESSKGSPEISRLVSHFNTMTQQLSKSQSEVNAANLNLRKTLAQLDKHSRAIEVVLSNVTTGVVSVDQNGVVKMINRHAAKLLDIDAKKYVEKKADKVLSEEYYAIFQELLTTMKSHKARSIQREAHINVNGRQVPLQMNLSVLYDDNESEIGRILVFDDLTVLQSAQRAAAWKEVARRIAHEIKNPLTPIRLSAQRLQRKFGAQIEDPAFSECTNMIMTQVDDLKELVNEFSTFARLPQSKPVISSLNKVVSEAMVLFKQAHKGIEFSFECDDELPDFLFDPDQLKRVITNLVDNAVSAFGNQRDAEVSVRTDYDNLLRIVKISVTDNGPGIPKYLKDRVFEPYITTKAQGTGLGLAIVKRTVEDHNGFIRAFPNQPNGTRIVIELPVVIANTTSELIRNEKLTDGELKT